MIFAFLFCKKHGKLRPDSEYCQLAIYPNRRLGYITKSKSNRKSVLCFGLNRVGNDGNKLHYNGSSHCFFADGSEIALLKDNLIYAELDKDLLTEFRRKFPF